MKAIKVRDLCTLAFCRIVAMIDCLNSNEHAQSDVQKFHSYPQAIAVLIVLKDLILQMLFVSHLHVNMSTYFKVLYLGVMIVKIVAWMYYSSYICRKTQLLIWPPCSIFLLT